MAALFAFRSAAAVPPEVTIGGGDLDRYVDSIARPDHAPYPHRLITYASGRRLRFGPPGVHSRKSRSRSFLAPLQVIGTPLIV